MKNQQQSASAGGLPPKHYQIRHRSIKRAFTMKKPFTNGTKPLVIDDYEKNLNLSIQWCRWILKPMGIWPNSSNVPQTQIYFYRLINAMCYSLLNFLLLPCSLYTILEVEDVYNKIKLFGPSSFCVMALLKYYLLILHGNSIRECIKWIEQDWENARCQEDKKIMMENANFGRKLILLCTFFMYSGFAFYYIAVPISVGKITAENENFTFVPLVFPFSSLIVDTRHSPKNEIIFLVQLVAGALMHSITAAACGLAAILAVHACGQMEVLMNWLKHLIDGRSDMGETVDVRIANVVNQHVKILRFLTLIEQILRHISLVEFLGCTLNLCLLSYYTIMEWNRNDMTSSVTYSVLLVSLTFNIFIFCYIGELVSEQCRKIGEMSYMIDWYRLPGKRKLCIILIIEMSNSSIKLTAGNIIEMCFSTFGDVVKTAVAFLNVLRTLT
ncbi:odorant receptor 4-like [Osmia lignaria lignaria]|uniref:odorant receptor 4-like n=1 Tax=Osmia lignaria lignaria TaxID=1437193 RepID=UPI00402B8107